MISSDKSCFTSLQTAVQQQQPQQEQRQLQPQQQQQQQQKPVRPYGLPEHGAQARRPQTVDTLLSFMSGHKAAVTPTIHQQAVNSTGDNFISKQQGGASGKLSVAAALLLNRSDDQTTKPIDSAFVNYGAGAGAGTSHSHARKQLMPNKKPKTISKLLDDDYLQHQHQHQPQSSSGVRETNGTNARCLSGADQSSQNNAENALSLDAFGAHALSNSRSSSNASTVLSNYYQLIANQHNRHQQQPPPPSALSPMAAFRLFANNRASTVSLQQPQQQQQSSYLHLSSNQMQESTVNAVTSAALPSFLLAATQQLTDAHKLSAADIERVKLLQMQDMIINMLKFSSNDQRMRQNLEAIQSLCNNDVLRYCLSSGAQSMPASAASSLSTEHNQQHQHQQHQQQQQQQQQQQPKQQQQKRRTEMSANIEPERSSPVECAYETLSSYSDNEDFNQDNDDNDQADDDDDDERQTSTSMRFAYHSTSTAETSTSTSMTPHNTAAYFSNGRSGATAAAFLANVALLSRERTLLVTPPDSVCSKSSVASFDEATAFSQPPPQHCIGSNSNSSTGSSQTSCDKQPLQQSFSFKEKAHALPQTAAGKECLFVPYKKRSFNFAADEQSVSSFSSSLLEHQLLHQPAQQQVQRLCKTKGANSNNNSSNNINNDTAASDVAVRSVGPAKKPCSREKATESKRSTSDQPKKIKRCPHVWQFCSDLLRSDAFNPSIIKWLNEEKGIFKIVKPDQVAELWGAQKNRKSDKKMNYEKMARGMRYSRREGFFKKLDKEKNKPNEYGKQLVFQFSEKVKNFGWKWSFSI